MDPARQTSEPRRDLAVPLPVEVVGREGVPRTEYAVNVSASGLCLHAPRPLPAGASLRVAFTLPDGGGRIEARARVAWSEAPPRSARARFRALGLRFEALCEADRRRLARFAAALAAGPGPGGDGAR